MAVMKGSVAFESYRLLARLGVGGSAEVLRALRRDADGREVTVALKRVLPERRGDAGHRARFLHEAALAQTLVHPNIVACMRYGEYDGIPFLEMEYVDGASLHDLFERSPRLPAALALFVAREVASALAYAHARRLLHRDVSPANVLISRDGRVRLSDFGIAKALAGPSERTRTGVRKGKRAYMAPEQLRGETLDERVDLFAAGLVLYEALTGTRPYGGDNDAAAVAAAPPSLLVPGMAAALEALALRAIARAPGERFQSASELAAALTAAGADGDGDGDGARAELARWLAARFPRAAEPIEATRTLSPRRSRGRLLLAGVVGAAMAVVAFVVARLPGPAEATRAPAEVTRAPAEVTRAPAEATRAPASRPVVPAATAAPSLPAATATATVAPAPRPHPRHAAQSKKPPSTLGRPLPPPPGEGYMPNPIDTLANRAQP